MRSFSRWETLIAARIATTVPSPALRAGAALLSPTFISMAIPVLKTRFRCSAAAWESAWRPPWPFQRWAVRLRRPATTALSRATSGSAGGRAPSPRKSLVHEGKLADHRRAQHERIEVRLAHAAVERVDREGQRQPGRDQPAQVAGMVRIEVDRGRQLRPAPDRGRTLRPKARAVSRVSTMCR